MTPITFRQISTGETITVKTKLAMDRFFDNRNHTDWECDQIEPLDKSLAAKMTDLVGDVDVDLDAPLPDEEKECD